MDPSRRSGEEEESTARPYNPPSIFRDSAFSRPILPASSSLLLPPKPLKPGPSNGSAGPGPGPADAGPDRYRECLRNHAASLGGHVVDGCGEFMSAAPAEPLKCAACGCHRSFHRRDPEPDASNPRAAGRSAVQLLLAAPPPPRGGGGFGSSTACTESSSEERNNNPLADPGGDGKRKKRFRTKFSGEQKEKMAGFAQRVGWRVQKKDEAEMERFCREVGVSRTVLKVWMHNNKHLFKKPPPQQNPHDLQPQQLQPQSEAESHGEKKGLIS